MSARRVQERKRHLQKPDEFYWCTEVHREPGYLVLRYDVPADSHIGPTPIPAGSVTFAHYREAIFYVLWEMLGPDRALIGYCYHLCRPPRIEEDYVEYVDLLLDLWFDPAGNLTVLDADELQAAVAAGKVTAEEAAMVQDQQAVIVAAHQKIVSSLWRPEKGADQA
jgi:hypothetical protein